MDKTPEWLKSVNEEDKTRAVFDMYNGYVDDALKFAAENREGFEADNLIHLMIIRQEVMLGMMCRTMAIMNVLPDEFINHMNNLHKLLNGVDGGSFPKPSNN
jgi:hypothetical protein